MARIHGYDAIPEDVSVPMAASARRREDRVDEPRAAGAGGGRLRRGDDDQRRRGGAVEAFSPWTDAAPLVTPMPILRRASYLRRSLIPSLLVARRTNETLANPTIELFEMARVYLPRAGHCPTKSGCWPSPAAATLLRSKG